MSWSIQLWQRIMRSSSKWYIAGVYNVHLKILNTVSENSDKASLLDFGSLLPNTIFALNTFLA